MGSRHLPSFLVDDGIFKGGGIRSATRRQTDPPWIVTVQALATVGGGSSYSIAQISVSSR